ncbi:uncharacterized protein LOC128986562 [Macrosteles quadrilineatus]|uniref:uncharacterized protein LOC128986562 n=1 Tax=Macrosteles quadrilineatus TaxID=74068 RepID=UPI0023E2A477|nr:uncharacterized protein LOC128986562 [Macrosteles quadrilineatus]
MPTFICLLSYAFITSTIVFLSGGQPINGTEEAGIEQQTLVNTTLDNTINEEVNAPEAAKVTEEVATEDEATEVGVIETEATQAEVTEDTSEALPTPLSVSQAVKDWSSRLLASKYMGSLVGAYVLLCLYLAIKQGPIIVH